MNTPSRLPLVRLAVALAFVFPCVSFAQAGGPALANPSFEFGGEKPEEVPGWGTWGGGIDRVDTWTPVRSGQGMVAYKHWVILDNGDSGLFQDAASVEAGGKYEFSLWIYADPAKQNGFGGVELRLESGIEGRQVTIATNTVAGPDIPVGRWSRILVRGTAPVANLRAVVVFFPSLQEPRDGAVKIDDAQIVRLP